MLTAVMLGLALRSLSHAGGYGRTEFALGGVMALALWAGPELLLPVLLCLAVMAVRWLAGDPGAGGRNLAVHGMFAAGFAGVLLLERGAGEFLVVEYDRVSAAHLTLILLLLSFWAAVRVFTQEGRPLALSSRLMIGLVGLAGTALAMKLLFPEIYQGPLAHSDPAMRDLVGRITEFEAAASSERFMIYVGGIVFAAPWALWRLTASWKTDLRWAWLMIFCALLVLVFTATVWLRAAPYAGLMLAVVLADLLVHLDGRLSARYAGAARIVVKTAVLSLVAVSPLAAGTALSSQSPAAGSLRSCPLKSMAAVLNEAPFVSRPMNILASADDGPELLYRTPHRVTATLHHRNAPGMLFNLNVLAATDEEEARRLILERRIDLIMLCRHVGGARFLRGRDDPAVFYRRLTTGTPPGWLQPVRLPPSVSAAYSLFRVTGGIGR